VLAEEKDTASPEEDKDDGGRLGFILCGSGIHDRALNFFDEK
jgi:hypothetical protein